MGELIKIIVFSLIAICSFAGFTSLGLPLIIPAAPPVEEKLTGDITMDQYIGIGKKIFNGKGTCTLCHNPVGGRAPLLGPVAQVAGDRLKDSRYKGEAKTAQDYIYESMTLPSAFVVVGFGKKGSNDTVSPMPDVSKGAIGLSDVEIYAVIAFLQDLAGMDVTVSLPTGEVAEEEEPQEIKVAENAKEAFGKFDCVTCHMGPQMEEGGDIGPDLSKLKETAGKRTKGLSAEQFVVESIINPNKIIAEGFDSDTMPDDFATTMTVAELDMIVAAILGKEANNGGDAKE